jgi:hypothetical protein
MVSCFEVQRPPVFTELFMDFRLPEYSTAMLTYRQRLGGSIPVGCETRSLFVFEVVENNVEFTSIQNLVRRICMKGSYPRLTYWNQDLPTLAGAMLFLCHLHLWRARECDLGYLVWASLGFSLQRCQRWKPVANNWISRYGVWDRISWRSHVLLGWGFFVGSEIWGDICNDPVRDIECASISCHGFHDRQSLYSWVSLSSSSTLLNISGWHTCPALWRRFTKSDSMDHLSDMRSFENLTLNNDTDLGPIHESQNLTGVIS